MPVHNILGDILERPLVMDAPPAAPAPGAKLPRALDRLGTDVPAEPLPFPPATHRKVSKVCRGTV